MAATDCVVDDCGDFVDSDDDLDLEVEAEAEAPSRYEEGLYYPLCIGDVLVDRYRIEHKLGHGGFSTVWMAHDTLDKRDVALKIIKPGNSGEYEYYLHNEIISNVRDRSFFLLYQGTFFLQGSHGQHRVLVFPVQGPNLRDYSRKTSIGFRMSALKQLLQGLQVLHQAGFVHRDLNTANVMYSLRPLDMCDTVTAKYQYLGRPQKLHLPYQSSLGRRAELVAPIKPHESIVGDTVLLGDFGLTIKAGTLVSQPVQSPNRFCAPERFHGSMPSFATDMWSYFCIFVQLYNGFSLLYGPADCSLVSNMVATLGPLPESWNGHFQAGGTSEEFWYDPQRKPDSRSSLEGKVSRSHPNISLEERQLVLSIMRKGFSYNPEHRWTAAQLLQDPSFKTLMGMYGL